MEFSKNVLLRISCGIYRGLLRLYPQEFRARYAKEMELTFRDHLQDTLVKNGIWGVPKFWLNVAGDLMASVLRERFTLKNAIGMIYVAVAMVFSIAAQYVDRHNVSEVYPTLMVALVGSFVVGILQPRWPWRWAIIIGLGVPFFGPPGVLPARLASPGRWAMLAVMMVPGLIGAYTGSLLRQSFGSPENRKTPASR